MKNEKQNFLLLIFLNKDFSVTVQVIKLNISVYVLKVLLKGSMSQNLDLCLTFHFMSKNNFFKFFFLHNIE